MRCLEREISIQRREEALAEREAELNRRENYNRGWRASRDPRLNFGNPKGRHRAAKQPRNLFPPPPPPYYDAPTEPRRPVLSRFVNKRGKEYFRYVDDVAWSAPARRNSLPDFIQEVRPAKFNGPERFGRNSRWFREAINQDMAERWTGVRALYNHEKEPNNKDSDSDEEGPNSRKRTRRGGRGGRAKRFKDGGACNPAHHGVKRRRGDDDDGEGPPEARDPNRERCHSNVYIRQNVNVQ